VPGIERSRGMARFEDFELDLRSAELRRNGSRAVRLADQPFRILMVLLEHPREIVSREEIRRRLWPNDTIVEFEHSISAAMNRLRQALGDSGDNPRYIETLARRGYRWTVPVKWVESSPAVAPPLFSLAAQQRTRQSLIGKKVSHYRILEVLGGGGMGVVYKAEDLRLGRCVAIKFLAEEFLGDRRALERFEREARAVSALDHPNICTIYEVEEHEGQPFIVMQLLQGETLRHRIESSAPEQLGFSRHELLDIAIAIAMGLNAAHQKGIIHRDVKPANIFITHRGEIKLLDFGLAKLVGAEGVPSESLTPRERETGQLIHDGVADAPKANLTLTGATMGTASYMSPEQVLKQPLDVRTDLFSFGAVLYEMATGRQPFRGDTTDAIHRAILSYTPPSPLLQNPELPSEIELITARALEKDPEKRYQSASQIISDLEHLRVAEAARVTSTKLGSPQDRRHPWIRIGAIGIAAILLLLAAGFVSRKWTARHLGLHVQNMEIARLTDSGAADNVAISPDGRYVVYSQHESSGVSLWMRQVTTGSDVKILPSTAVDTYGLTFSRDGQYIYFVPDENAPGGRHSLYMLPALGGAPHLLIKDDIDSPVSFSPDGQRFVFTNGLGDRNLLELRIANKDGSDNRLLAGIVGGSQDFQPGPAWSPDGGTIALAVMLRDTQVRFALDLVRVNDGSVRQIYSSAFGIGRPVWLSTDSLVVPLRGRSGRGQLWTISYPGGESERLTNDLEDYRYFGVDFSRDARILVATNSTQISNIWVGQAGNPSAARQITFGKLSMLEVTTTSQRKVLGRSGEGRLWVVNAETSQRSLFADAHNVVSLTSCGRFVLFESFVADTVDLVRVDADGTNAVKLISGDIGPPICSADGYIFYSNIVKPQTISRIGIQGGSPVQIAQSPGFAILGRLSVSPDARFLAFAYDEAAPAMGTKLAVIAATGGPVVKSYVVPGDVSGLCWSPDGHRLQYLLTRNGSTNIWEQPLDGSQPSQLTAFTSGRIFDFNWSQDGKQLVLARGEVNSDVVFLSNLH
jgi:serine/threonine protein kinase/Tol biopolymer transport system component